MSTLSRVQMYYCGTGLVCGYLVRVSYAVLLKWLGSPLQLFGEAFFGIGPLYCPAPWDTMMIRQCVEFLFPDTNLTEKIVKERCIVRISSEREKEKEKGKETKRVSKAATGERLSRMGLSKHQDTYLLCIGPRSKHLLLIQNPV